MYCLEEILFDQQRISPLGDKIHPWGSKFAPRGEVKNGPQFVGLVSGGGSTLQELLTVLAKETGRSVPRLSISQAPITEEEILNRFLLAKCVLTYNLWFHFQLLIDLSV
jgi:hypothetical protein